MAVPQRPFIAKLHDFSTYLGFLFSCEAHVASLHFARWNVWVRYCCVATVLAKPQRHSHRGEARVMPSRSQWPGTVCRHGNGFLLLGPTLRGSPPTVFLLAYCPHSDSLCSSGCVSLARIEAFSRLLTLLSMTYLKCPPVHPTILVGLYSTWVCGC